MSTKTKYEFILSFYTTCSGRLWQLEQTIDHNLNICHRNRYQMCLANYNSKDGLDEFIYKKYMKYIKMGCLKYFYTQEPEEFDMAIAKNLAARLTDGIIIFNLDADNFIFEEESRALCSSEFIDGDYHYRKRIYHENPHIRGGTAGRIVCKRSDFMKLKGYDESLRWMGWQDRDFKGRLNDNGIMPYEIKNLPSDRFKFPIPNREKHSQRRNNSEKNNRLLTLDRDKSGLPVNPNGFRKFRGKLNFLDYCEI